MAKTLYLIDIQGMNGVKKIRRRYNSAAGNYQLSGKTDVFMILISIAASWVLTINKSIILFYIMT